MSSLLQKTIELMQDQKTMEVRDATGLNYHWLVALKQGKIPDPGVQKIQLLYEYLTGKKIKL